MKPIIIVSADGHAGGRIEEYRAYLDAHSPGTYGRLSVENDRYVDATSRMLTLPDHIYEAIDERRRLRDGGVEAVFSPATRLAELDAEGIAAEVLFPGHQAATTPCFTGANEVYAPSERAAGARAYNRWLADFVAAGEGRLAGVADIGCSRDMKAAVEEARWAAEHGLVAISVPNDIADPELPPIQDKRYEPFWRACAEAGLVLSIHAGWGGEQGVILSAFEAYAANGGVSGKENFGDSAVFMAVAPRRALWQIMLAGVFDRYPELKLVLTEVRADWVPATLAHLDKRFAEESTPLKMKPSEYWERNCFVTPSGIRRTEVQLRHEIGAANFMFGADYPHYEGSWPNSIDWIRDAFRDAPEVDARKILGENAIEVFGFDRQRLESVAARIGLKPSDLLGEHVVDKRKIAHFHARSGYSSPAETVDLDLIDRNLDEDFRLLRAAS